MDLKSVFCFLILVIGVHCSVLSEDRIEKTKTNLSDITPDAFISGGAPARIGQFPWVVRLSIRDRHSSATYLCGGSLISKRHVLTAAHCVKHEVSTYNDLKIYLGEYNRESYPRDCVQGKCTKNLIVYPDKITKHAQYNPITIENDIALLRLQKNAPVGGAIQVIALPPFDVDNPDNDPYVTVTGWGRTDHGGSTNILQRTELKLIPQERCQQDNSDVPTGHLCAGDPNGRDTCSGDSGGPLMMFHQDQYYLSGVVSYGPAVRCGTANTGFYTNVFKYMQWIKTNMKI